MLVHYGTSVPSNLYLLRHAIDAVPRYAGVTRLRDLVFIVVLHTLFSAQGRSWLCPIRMRAMHDRFGAAYTIDNSWSVQDGGSLLQVHSSHDTYTLFGSVFPILIA